MGCFQSPQCIDKNGSTPLIFNSTTRAYLLISALITILGIILVALIGPSKFDIAGVKFSFCATHTNCSQHLVAYSFAFGLMVTWFLSAVILLLCKSCKYAISKWLLPVQVLCQFGATIGATYMNELVYKIGYWMFFNAIKYYFLQSLLIVQGLKYVYRSFVSQEQYKFVWRFNLFSLALYCTFTALNAVWFFGERCSNHFDVLIVCTVTINVLGALLALFDNAFGFFLPLHLATISQAHLFIIFHASPYAISCGRSPLLGQEKWFQWILFAILLISLILAATKILGHFTSQRAIPELNQSSATLLRTQNNNSYGYQPPLHLERNETLLFDSGVKRHFGSAKQPHHGGINTPLTSESTPYSDPFVSKWHDGSTDSFSSPKSQLNKHTITPIIGPRYFQIFEIEDIDNTTFVEHYFYNPNKFCAASVRSYFIATFIFSLFVFMLSHFGEHTGTTTLGLTSDHIQWFFVMSSGWQYFIYVWSILAQTFCPMKQMS